jgi:hypothetical protein
LLAYFASKKVKIMIPLGAAACMREPRKEKEKSERPGRTRRGKVSSKMYKTSIEFPSHPPLVAGLGFYMYTRVFEYNSHMRCLSRKKPDPARPYQPANTRIHIKDRARISSRARKKLLLHWFRVDDEE